jgi:hypothetical protein
MRCDHLGFSTFQIESVSEAGFQSRNHRVYLSNAFIIIYNLHLSCLGIWDVVVDWDGVIKFQNLLEFRRCIFEATLLCPRCAVEDKLL